MVKKYHIIVFGCQMNIADKERVSTRLEENDYIETSDIKEADLIIIIACSVRQSAIDRIHGLIPQLKSSKAKIALTGCVLPSDREKFKNLFDYVLDIKDLNKWPLLQKKKNDYLNIPPKRESNFQALIPISNGCENFCTYCAVPFTRGPLICRDYGEIIKEAKNAVKEGIKEIWLLGQNVNDYQYDNIDFADLLRKINNIKGDFWIRFTSPHPKNFSDKTIKCLSECEKITPYINLPIQAGDDAVLKKMNRPYTYKQYKKLAEKIKKAFNKRKEEVTLSTDIIVGFPEETKKQFNNSVKAIKEIEFDMAYIAQYSPRPDSFACLKMKDNIKKQEKRRREEKLTETLKEIALKKNKKYLNRELNVLVLRENKGYYIGKSWEYKTVRFKSNKNLLGNIVKIKITKALPWGLEGRTI